MQQSTAPESEPQRNGSHHIRAPKRCPRCGGNLFLNNDHDDWYTECLQCSFTRELAIYPVYQWHGTQN